MSESIPSASFVPPASASTRVAVDAPEPMSKSEAFDALVRLLYEWRGAGRVSTTAGLKAGLAQRTLGGFSESALGFSDFREFVEAAVVEGRVKLEQLPTKHWLVLLPGESVDDVPTSSRSRSAGRPGGTSAADTDRSADEPLDQTSRLRREVWQCFVDWSADHQRVWDRVERRSFMYPVDGNGQPAWLSNPARFADIPVADMTTQLDWMREWASTVEEPDDRQVLLASIGTDARPGQFRAQLERLDLVAAWRTELQRRILSYAHSWARSEQVALGDLLDHRKPRSPEPAHASTAASSPAISGGTHLEAPTRAPSISRSSSEEDDTMRLRAMLHAAIDRMSLTELANLPVRAEHLLGRVR